jgi:tripartite-type tricarboxylate transporter receptor subunit TctC
MRLQVEVNHGGASHRLAAGVVAALGCFLPDPAHAQAFPVKPVRLIIPFVAGGPGDTVGRMVTPKLAEHWGHQIIVDNRGGANSIVGTEIAARAPADGHTLLLVSAGFAINVSLYPKLPYDPHRDLLPLAPITFGPSILVAHPSVPARNLKELIALAKAKPGALTFASAGVGAPGSHLAVELIKVNARIDLVHVPYKSMAPGMTDLLGGQVHLASPTIVVALPHIRSGRVRAIGITADKRSAAAPDIATIAEQGMPGYEANNWYAIMAPGALPAALANRIAADVAKVAQLAEVRERMAGLGMEARSMMPNEFATYVKSEIVKWGKVVKAAGVKPDQ